MSVESFFGPIIEGKRRDFAAFLIIALLTPFSWLYRIGLKVFLLPYALGIRQKRRLPKRVVSVGNITFGGTGKTPAVQAIVRQLVERGVKPGILTRGHGGSVEDVYVTDKEEPSEIVGDEAAMLLASLPGVPVGVGKKREESGRAVLKKHEIDLFILDDGLQYWQLHRDFDIMVVAAHRPVGSGRVMPAGDLREPVGGLRRASAIIVVGDDEAGAGERKIKGIAPGVPVFRAFKAPVGLSGVSGEKELPCDWLKDRSVCALSGIGDPAGFENTIKGLGAKIVESRRFPDHYRFQQEDIAAVIETAEKSGCEAVVTTAKDAMRLPEVSGNVPVYVLNVALAIESMDKLIDLILSGDKLN